MASSSGGFRRLVLLNLQRGWRNPFVATGFGGLAEDFADQGAADSVELGDLGQAASGLAVTEDGIAIDVQWAAPDMQRIGLHPEYLFLSHHDVPPVHLKFCAIADFRYVDSIQRISSQYPLSYLETAALKSNQK